MNSIVTQAIVLARIDYGEADRILTVLTPDHGKLSLMAKGVRRVKSKLAGSVELFSVSTITFVQGRGSVGTLISARLDTHYGRIVQDLDRTMLGYELIKQLNKITEDQAEKEYFELLGYTFEALDDPTIDPALTKFWFTAQMLRLSGHTPNLRTDTGGKELDVSQRYDFDIQTMCFRLRPSGRFVSNHIKFLRLSFGDYSASSLASVGGGSEQVADLGPLMEQMRRASQ